MSEARALRLQFIFFVALASGACARKGPPAVECRGESECRAQCEAKVGAACYRLGELRLGSAQARSGAAEAFGKACALEVPKGCARAALQPGAEAAKVTQAQAQRPALVTACGQGDAEACELAQGLGAQTLAQAVALRRAACERGEAPGCLRAAELLEPTTPEGAEGQAAIIALYERGCSLELAGACAALGLKYLRGQGVDVDPEKAKGFMRRAAALSGASADAGHGSP